MREFTRSEVAEKDEPSEHCQAQRSAASQRWIDARVRVRRSQSLLVLHEP